MDSWHADACGAKMSLERAELAWDDRTWMNFYNMSPLPLRHGDEEQ